MKLGTEVSVGSGDIVLDETQLLPPKKKGAQQPRPTSRPMPIVAKRSPISATAELLF